MSEFIFYLCVLLSFIPRDRNKTTFPEDFKQRYNKLAEDMFGENEKYVGDVGSNLTTLLEKRKLVRCFCTMTVGVFFSL